METEAFPLKKRLSLLLILVLLLGCFVGCSGKTEVKEYTLRAAVTTYLGSWEPIWYDNPQEKAVAALLNCPLWESVIQDTKTGAYQWVFLGAESLEDVTETCQADLEKYGGETVFQIRLRKEMCWDDGACIDADTYLYSLDMLVRSRTRLVEGVGALAGAKDYFCTEHVFKEKVGCYAVDDYTLRYVCQEKTTKQELMLALAEPFLLHPVLHDSNIYSYCSNRERTISCGPYRLTQADNGEIILVQNERYWEYRKENGRLVSTTSFQVDGKNLPQYQTNTIIITKMTEAEARQAYREGKIDYWDAGEAESISFLTNEKLYRKGQSFVLRLFFNTTGLEQCDAEYGNKNSIVLSSEKFRKAMSLAFDRADWVTATEGYAPALGLINDLSYYNETSQYRDSLAGKQALCDLYGVDAEGYNALTGYDLTQAKQLMAESCAELVEAGLYKAGENIHIRIAWKNGQLTREDAAQAALLEKYLQEAMEGSGFGKLTLEAVGCDGDRYLLVRNRCYAIGLGAWGGKLFDPYSVLELYCTGFVCEGGCWDPQKEKLTLTVNGEEMKKSWAWWAENLSGDGELASLDEATRLELLATLEQKLLEKYYAIPLASTADCFLLSEKLHCYTGDYNALYGFGGVRLLQYDHTDAQWQAKTEQ